jgi:hypothetical protein
LGELDANQDILLIRKHLVEHLGPPDEVFEVSGSPIPGSPMQALNLAYFAPAGPHSPVVFATCGAAQYTMKDGRRIEGILILRREPDAEAFDAVHRLLASFALFAEANDQVIRHGDVVHAPEELSKFCDMDALLFMPPIPFVQTFHTLQVTQGKEVEILWLLPVYDAEAEYALANGPQSLMMLFAAQSLDLTEPHRAEANTMMEAKDAAEMAKRMGEEHARRTEAEGPKPMAQPAKPKTSRRTIGKGSFEVEEEGGAVKISRRNKPKKPAPPPPAKMGTTPAEVASNQQPVPARKKPIIAAIPKRKEETRFDLGDKKPQSSEPKLPARPKKVEEPKDDPETAKKKRIDELKKKAQDAAQRAKQRKQSNALDEPSGPIIMPGPNMSSAQAASNRRGAPKRAIEDQLDDEES